MIVDGHDIRISGRLLRIARIDGDKYNTPEDPESLIAALRKCGKRIDVFTFLQKLPDSTPRYSYPAETDNLAVLDISTFDHWWNHQIKSYPRNRARQAGKKGVVLREQPCDEKLMQGICDIYNETPVRQGRPFPHYGMTLEKARSYASTYPDRSIYVGAFLDETMIGFIKLVMDEDRKHACLVHILSMVKHKDKAPTNALIAHAVKVCAERGLSYLVYEHFTYGNKSGDSLSHFKEVNGFRQMDLPRYYVPFTAVGQLGLRLGLHHRFFDRVPAPIAAKIREVRKSLLERKVETQSAVES
jgi:hypothetical protein